ncbi:MAG: hypothetical protein GF414_09585 [Candidatus Altiarchaeales archaeon]|nr:hypothetical protein [Candidatus Altiarchaeales archaeon]
MKEQAFKAFVRGFIVMLIGVVIFVTMVNPNSGFAQEENRNPNNVDVERPESSELLYTDDPLGRVIISLEEEKPLPLTNNGDAVDSPPSTIEREAEGNGNGSSEPMAGSAPSGVESFYSSPLIIPAADFRSDGYDPDGIFFFFSGGYAEGEHNNSCMMAPVYLPDGVTIEEIYATVYDNDSGSDVNVFVKLYRMNNYSGTTDLMAYMETTSESTNVQIIEDTTIDYPNILYPNYSYYLGACLQSINTRIYSVQIYY